MKKINLALRHLSRQKLNTTLHIVGLTLGMSVCLVIGLFLHYEMSFDRYHNYADRTFRINSTWNELDKNNYTFSTPLPMSAALRSEAVGPEKTAMVHPLWSNVVEVSPQKIFQEDRMLVVEPEFLDIFTVTVVKGDARKALSEPYRALLTETIARKYYGTEDPVGKSFKYKNEFDITVAGIIKDFPSNTHLQASMLLSYVANGRFLGNDPNNWTSVSGTETFVLLPENFDEHRLDTLFKSLADKHINSEPDLPKSIRAGFKLQPLKTVHFEPSYAGGGPWLSAINPSWLWFFGSIGLCVLVLACINFINLSTAQAITRAKEIGIRKSIGAGKANLITQFLREAWVVSIISGILAIAVVQVLLPYINLVLGKGIMFNVFESPMLMLALIGGIFMIGLLAGIYPAWLISRFNPALTLKGYSTSGDHGSSFLRQTLVVTQFTISAGLLIALILIAQQVDFMRNKDLGFEKDNIINVGIPNAAKSTLFASELSRVAGVKDISFATATPSNDGHWGTVMTKTDRNDPDRKGVTMILGDENFCQMYGLRLLSGRYPMASDTSFNGRYTPDDQRVIKTIVNEKLVEELGIESNEAAIGKHYWAGFNGGNMEIIGVVGNFNTGSLREAISPTLIAQLPDVYGQAGIKIEGGSDIQKTLSEIETAWRKAYPDGVFQFKFLDDQIQAFYQAEQRLFVMFRIFAGLAMLISCLGLWGLATFTAQQRTKEIGIRKVLGASVTSITQLLSKDFLKLVMIAIVISVPLSWYLMNNWLQNFAFHINIGAGVFIIAGFIAASIALATVSFQSIKAALANPVDSLRSE